MLVLFLIYFHIYLAVVTNVSSRMLKLEGLFLEVSNFKAR